MTNFTVFKVADRWEPTTVYKYRSARVTGIFIEQYCHGLCYIDSAHAKRITLGNHEVLELTYKEADVLHMYIMYSDGMLYFGTGIIKNKW